ncbi:helix-turn-helix domain-containing protein [Pasteurellaceae bacterium USgator11]|nr:helix-turn-helix domain-containing protein [Pasteurellaceae bacterium USgator41]TNG96449.1 helix-turn-helix domain-containing protein [Pasteurellaceae bacterium UScroc12]TNH00469.1 helix-turn-helix domain-containing protein [Pasteurellaceae bacterium UScroc31]TNH01700.1 helix-turn-helix domain-containing protein [Pasteurellaceae bacterium USgator11]
MSLEKYLSGRPRGFKSDFAHKLGISTSFLRQIETGYSKIPPALAKKIEYITNGDLNKSDLRPDLWG